LEDAAPEAPEADAPVLPMLPVGPACDARKVEGCTLLLKATSRLVTGEANLTHAALFFLLKPKNKPTMSGTSWRQAIINCILAGDGRACQCRTTHVAAPQCVTVCTGAGGPRQVGTRQGATRMLGHGILGPRHRKTIHQ
jgi:hypothetical protein